VIGSASAWAVPSNNDTSRVAAGLWKGRCMPFSGRNESWANAIRALSHAEGRTINVWIARF
jgi:hypothetical protein